MPNGWIHSDNESRPSHFLYKSLREFESFIHNSVVADTVRIHYVVIMQGSYPHASFVLSSFVPVLLGVAVAAAALFLAASGELTAGGLRSLPPFYVVVAAASIIAAAVSAKLRHMCRPKEVYLVEYGCFRPRPCYRAPVATCREHAQLMPELFDQQSINFMMRLMERSGLGAETCVPLAYHYIPPDQSLEAAREEAELVIFSAIDEAFAKTTSFLKPADVDVLVLNCSVLAPTPSFADMVVNRYKLRPDVRTFNLSGMGCSAALVSVGLVGNILRVAPPGTRALIVSTEILSSTYYTGTDPSMLLPNCLFRMGAAATILSNSPEGARFRLGPVVRTVTSARDADYRCVYMDEDDKGNTAIRLSRNLPAAAGRALRDNVAAFAPLVLPSSEQVRVALPMLKRKLLLLLGRRAEARLCRPDFRTAFQHFCIHAGGRGVINEAQDGLGLTDDDVEASRMTLHRFGNTSSSSVLYELAYTEAKGRMKKGDRVWMVSFGAGFECNSVAWVCIKTGSAAGNDDGGPWADSIKRYPVHLPVLA
ncbi:hypothetical protein ZWY2020_036968 [Hordeum vulgare]|nr:hypothetical protein ZWY2020_036968 [Hordeum vulgare]